MYSVQCTLYIVHCTVCPVQYTVYTLILHWVLYSIQCTLFTVHWVLYCIQCSLYRVQFTLHYVQCEVSSVTYYTSPSGWGGCRNQLGKSYRQGAGAGWWSGGTRRGTAVGAAILVAHPCYAKYTTDTDLQQKKDGVVPLIQEPF